MALDIIAAIVIVWGLVRGWLRGFLFQIGQIGVLAVAFVVARGTRELVEPRLADLLGTGPGPTSLLAFVGVFLAVFALGSVLLRAFTRDLHEASETIGAGDRALGALLGVVKGGLVVYLAFVVVIMVNQTTGQMPVPYGSSVAGRWVMQHNFFETGQFPRARALAKLGYLLGTRDTAELVRNPHFQAILEHPKAATLLTPEVRDALARRDWVALMEHDAIWDLLDEPEVQEHLNAIEWAEEHGPADDPAAAPPAQAPPAQAPPAPAPANPGPAPPTPGA